MSYLRRLGASPAGATLDLNFRTRLAAMKTSTGFAYGVPVESIVTTARALGAWNNGPLGTLDAVAANTLRYSYDPVSNFSRGLLCEPGAVNLNAAANTLSTWGLNNMTATANAEVDIAGNNAATAFTGSASGSYAAQGLTIPGTNEYFTTSLYFKSTSYMWLELAIFNGAALVGAGRVYFNPATGQIQNIAQLTGTTTGGSISPAPNGYYRVSVWNSNVGGAGTSAIISFGFTLSTGAALACMSQLEAGAGATSMIVSPASSSTRNADLPTISMSPTPPWWNQTEGAFYLECIDNDPTGAAIAQTYLLSVSDGGSNIMDLSLSTDNNFYWQSSTGTFLQITGSARGNQLRFALSYLNGGAWNAAKTGGGEDYTADTPNGVIIGPSEATPSPLTRIDIGHAFGNAPARMTVQRLAYIPRQLLPAEMSTLVTA